MCALDASRTRAGGPGGPIRGAPESAAGVHSAVFLVQLAHQRDEPPQLRRRGMVGGGEARRIKIGRNKYKNNDDTGWFWSLIVKEHSQNHMREKGYIDFIVFLFDVVLY